MARVRYDKLLSGICESPKNVRLADACKAAEKLGFEAKRQRGSHHAFSKTGEPNLLNFQEIDGGLIKPYQARQLISMIQKYWSWKEDRMKTEVEIGDNE